MNLVVDIGNSRVKAGVFDGGNLIHYQVFTVHQTSELKKILHSFPSIRFAIVSSVLSHSKEIQNTLVNKVNCVEFNFNTQVPLINKYQTPESLGQDRLAGAVGALMRFPHSNCLIIDAGTCIKYDFVSAQGEYFGGAISPGLEMRFRALNILTDRLPLLTQDLNFNELVGNSTKNSILSGVQNGSMEEIKGIINRYRTQYPNLKCVLTGGDWQFFENGLKNSIFAAPYLLLEGLNEILLYHVQKKNL